MQDKYEIVTLCGSTRFKKEFLGVQELLTLQGKIVISVGVFSQSDGVTLTESKKVMLSKMHKRKIDMADWIFVINKNGYIGENTKSEIQYAMSQKKPIVYLE